MKRKRRRTAALLAVLLLCTAFAQADLEQSDCIEIAFELLEEGNPFAVRYTQITGREITALFPLGVPYLWGGKNSYNCMFRDYPDYSFWKCPNSSDFFREGLQYFCGLDCSGFTCYINRKLGRPDHDTLTNMLIRRTDQRDYHLYNQTPEKQPPPYHELKDTLQAGDFLLIHHEGSKYRHIMMYIGTLRDYGYTAEQEPELAPYLDYPLVIHCGNSPVYGERFQQLIEMPLALSTRPYSSSSESFSSMARISSCS